MRRDRRLAWTFIVAFFIVDGLLRFGYFWFEELARHSGTPILEPFINEMTGSAAMILVFFPLVAFFRGFPWRRDHALTVIPVWLAGFVAYSALKTLFLWGTRAALYPLAGLGTFDYGDMLFRFPMEAFNDVLSYALFGVGVHVWDFYQAARANELRAARLEASLQQARLKGLEARIQPHFLFNTLNTISSVMYRDPEEADRMLSQLSDLLRLTLESGDAQEITVEEEVHTLRLYLDIMRARYPDRLRADIRVDPEAGDASVPRFLLQPLVENSIRHGISRRQDSGRIAVDIARSDGVLRIRVEDDGPGIAGDPARAIGRGIGLSSTRDRLRHLYGDAASLSLANREPHGLVVSLALPLGHPGGRAERSG